MEHLDGSKCNYSVILNPLFDLSITLSKRAGFTYEAGVDVHLLMTCDGVGEGGSTDRLCMMIVSSIAGPGS